MNTSAASLRLKDQLNVLNTTPVGLKARITAALVLGILSQAMPAEYSTSILQARLDGIRRVGLSISTRDGSDGETVILAGSCSTVSGAMARLMNTEGDAYSFLDEQIDHLVAMHSIDEVAEATVIHAGAVLGTLIGDTENRDLSSGADSPEAFAPRIHSEGAHVMVSAFTSSDTQVRVTVDATEKDLPLTVRTISPGHDVRYESCATLLDVLGA